MVPVPQERTFDTGVVRLNYLDQGPATAEPLVMLHGGAWRWQEYLSLIPRLSRRWHIFALDLRGNGRSTWAPGAYRLEDFADDTSAFIEQLNARAVLVGHSIGGVIALMVAARCPDRVKALVIEDVPLTLDHYRGFIDESRGLFRQWLDLKRAARSEQDLALALADAYQEYPGVTSAWVLFSASCLWQLDPTFFDALLYDFDGFARGYDPPRILETITCPILFVTGESRLGAVMTDEEVGWLRQHFGHVTCAQIGGVGHLLHLQDQGQAPVLAEMLGFLDRVPR